MDQADFGLKSRGWYGKLKANNGMNKGIFYKIAKIFLFCG